MEQVQTHFLLFSGNSSPPVSSQKDMGHAQHGMGRFEGGRAGFVASYIAIIGCIRSLFEFD